MIWSWKMWLQNLRLFLPYSDSVFLPTCQFQPRQLLAIRGPRWGCSCSSLPFRKGYKTYPGWKGLEMYKSMAYPGPSRWPATIELPLTTRVLGQYDHIEVLMDAHAPLACSLHVSEEKKGFWYKFLNCPIDCKLLHWVTNRTPSRKINDSYSWYFPMISKYFIFKKCLVLRIGSIFIKQRNELTAKVNQSPHENQPNELEWILHPHALLWFTQRHQWDLECDELAPTLLVSLSYGLWDWNAPTSLGRIERFVLWKHLNPTSTLSLPSNVSSWVDTDNTTWCIRGSWKAIAKLPEV